MPINFPLSPATNDTYTYNGKAWTYNGTGWTLTLATVGAGLIVSATAPSAPTNGTSWFDLNTGITYTWVNDGDSSAWVEGGPATPRPAGREVLAAARTYYVATTGNDTNDGLAVGTPFLTVQKAIDVVSNTIDMGVHQVTIQIANGTYTDGGALGSYLGKVRPIIQGDIVTPANVLFNLTSKNCMAIGAPGAWTVQGFKIVTTTSGSGLTASAGGSIYYKNLDFGSIATGHIVVGALGFVAAIGPYNITGGAQYHVASTNGGIVTMDGYTLTITGTPTFSTAFAYLRTLGIYSFNGTVFSGSTGGAKYNASLNSVLFANGNTLPGTTTSLTTGAQVG